MWASDWQPYPLCDFVHFDVEEVEVLVEVLVFEEALADHLRKRNNSVASARLTAEHKDHDATGGAARGERLREGRSGEERSYRSFRKQRSQPGSSHELNSSPYNHSQHLT